MIITPEEFHLLRVSGSYTLVDVRNPEELIGGRQLPESLNIPLKQLPEALGDLPSDQLIITMCEHGIRSLKAATFLNHNGFNAVSLVGGFEAWTHFQIPLTPGDFCAKNFTR